MSLAQKALGSVSPRAVFSQFERWLGSDEAARDESAKRGLAELLIGARPIATIGGWEQAQLQEAAEKHGVLGLLPGLTPGWAQAARGLNARAMRALRFTSRAVAAVEAAGIPCVVLKGAASAARWTEPAARQQSDVDLLVARADLKRASNALIDAQVSSTEFMAGEHMHNASLHPKEKGGLTIELHHALNSNHEVRVDIAQLLSRRIRLPTAQGEVPALAPEDDAAYLAMHAATHALARLAWLVDLQGLGRAGVNWVVAAERARAWNIAIPVECAWRQARELLAVPIPDEAFDRLGTALPQRAVVRALFKATWATTGVSHLWLERAFRLTLVPPAYWPLLALHKARARREDKAAYGY